MSKHFDDLMNRSADILSKHGAEQSGRSRSSYQPRKSSSTDSPMQAICRIRKRCDKLEATLSDEETVRKNIEKAEAGLSRVESGQAQDGARKIQSALRSQHAILRSRIAEHTDMIMDAVSAIRGGATLTRSVVVEPSISELLQELRGPGRRPTPAALTPNTPIGSTSPLPPGTGQPVNFTPPGLYPRS